MAATYVPIQSITLASNTSFITFASIPQTYTDLVLRITARAPFTNTPHWWETYFMFGGSEYQGATRLQGNGSAAASNRISNNSDPAMGLAFPASNATANTFGSIELYLPNYSGSAKKVWSIHAATEDNASAALTVVAAASDTATNAVSIIFISPLTDLAAGSTIHLYGIKATA